MSLYMLNIILVVFPFLIYLVFLVLDNASMTKEKDLFFAFSIITSIYLITKYNYDIGIIKVILFICLLKNKKNISLIIMNFISLYTMDFIVLFNYIYLITLYFIVFKNLKKEYKMAILIILEILFGNYTSILYMLISWILVNIFDKFEKVIDIHKILKEIEYEKDIKENLFKMVHEVKNPLAVSKGYIDMLDTNNSDQVGKYIPIIRNEIDKSIMIMNEYMSLNKLQVDMIPMDLCILLDEIIDEMKLFLENKNIKFIYNVPNDEINILGDYDKLKQVFVNIIKNSIEAESKNIILDVKKGKNIFIKIIDDGIGIKDIKMVGEAFYTTKKNGTGLGVKLSKEIIKLHGGSIDYKCNKVGTEVLIKIKKLI